jgi:SAM-dependent methyltransferase
VSAKPDLQSVFYPESRTGGFTDVDGTLAFYLRVNALVEPDSVVLDVGCGRGAHREDPVRVRREIRTFRGRCRRAIGLDVDETALENDAVDEVRLIRGPRWPVDDASIDVCVCDYVLEHVEDPMSFLRECARVLREGGHLCIRTINKWSYVGLAARLTPFRGHVAFIRRLAPLARTAADVFPATYRCNTQRELRAALQRCGFEASVFGHSPEPTYLEFSRFLYRFGVWYQRLAPRPIAVALHAFARKPVSTTGGS